MANRPVFMVSLEDEHSIRCDVEFQYFPGFSKIQKHRCINSLHSAFNQIHKNKNILEISTNSETSLGVQLSAFNLLIKTKSGNEVSVESAFQSSKVFENGGPYTDLQLVSPSQAKKDPRIRNSGRIIYFKFAGRLFCTEPKTYFYNWLYINTLHLHPELCCELLNFDAFTDISFNPQKSINCQAEAASIYVSLSKKGLIERALENKDAFLKIVYPSYAATLTTGDIANHLSDKN